MRCGMCIDSSLWLEHYFNTQYTYNHVAHGLSVLFSFTPVVYSNDNARGEDSFRSECMKLFLKHTLWARIPGINLLQLNMMITRMKSTWILIKYITTYFSSFPLLGCAGASLGLIAPQSTRWGISAASHGPIPKHRAWAMPNLGLRKQKHITRRSALLD